MQNSSKPLTIVWGYSGDLNTALDKATWLSTTKALRSLGCEVDLICNGEQTCKSIDGVDVLYFPSTSIYFLGKLIFHLKIIQYIFKRFGSLDILLFHPESGIFFLPLLFFRRLFRRPRPLFVVDIRTLPMASSGETNWRIKIRMAYFDFIQYIFNRYIDGQTAITKRLAEYYRIPANKLWGIWTSGVDVDKFQSCLVERNWEHIQDAVHLIYIGTLNDGRNIGVFCQAVINRTLNGQRFTFTVVGTGFERPQIEQFAQDYPQIIRYQPPVNHGEIPSFLTHAHTGVLPFPDEVKFQVSSPIKLFEYMAAGLPILATRIRCHTDVINDEDFVFWASESSVSQFEITLADLWENREKLQKMGRNAANAAQSWDWLEIAKKLKTALESGLNS